MKDYQRKFLKLSFQNFWEGQKKGKKTVFFLKNREILTFLKAMRTNKKMLFLTNSLLNMFKISNAIDFGVVQLHTYFCDDGGDF